jgi:hypothetical protein
MIACRGSRLRSPTSASPSVAARASDSDRGAACERRQSIPPRAPEQRAPWLRRGTQAGWDRTPTAAVAHELRFVQLTCNSFRVDTPRKERTTTTTIPVDSSGRYLSDRYDRLRSASEQLASDPGVAECDSIFGAEGLRAFIMGRRSASGAVCSPDPHGSGSARSSCGLRANVRVGGLPCRAWLVVLWAGAVDAR